MKIAKKIQKIRTVKKNKSLGSFLYGKLQQKEYSLKLKFMRKGKTQYVRDAINAELGRRYLEKEYAWYLKAPKQKYSANEKLPKIVWWCWLQGLDKAPLMVKMCLNSINEEILLFYNSNYIGI